MIHYFAHCDFKSERMYNLKVHLRNKHIRKHKTRKEEVEEYPLPMRSDEQPTDRDLIEDSIEVFEIYKILQRLKNK